MEDGRDRSFENRPTPEKPADPIASCFCVVAPLVAVSMGKAVGFRPTGWGQMKSGNKVCLESLLSRSILGRVAKCYPDGLLHGYYLCISRRDPEGESSSRLPEEV